MASPTQWTWVWVSPGVGDGQGDLACCSPCVCKESDTTKRLNWTELNSPVVLHWPCCSHCSSLDHSELFQLGPVLFDIAPSLSLCVLQNFPTLWCYKMFQTCVVYPLSQSQNQPFPQGAHDFVQWRITLETKIPAPGVLLLLAGCFSQAFGSQCPYPPCYFVMVYLTLQKSRNGILWLGRWVFFVNILCSRVF